MDFTGGTVGKNLPISSGDARDSGSIPGSERSPGVANGNTLQYSCLGNPIHKRSPVSMQSMGCKAVGQGLETKQQQQSR